jgi:hypothetical protein
MPGHACCPKVWLHLAVLCHEQVGPRTVATQSPDSVMQHPERRYVEVERLDDLEAFLAIIEKGSQAAVSRIFDARCNP